MNIIGSIQRNIPWFDLIWFDLIWFYFILFNSSKGMKNRDAGLNTEDKLQNDPGTYNHPMQIQWHFKVWRSRVIPFVIGENLSKATRDVIASAIQRIKSASCLTFREAVDSDQQWIKFVDCPLCQCGFVGKFIISTWKNTIQGVVVRANIFTRFCFTVVLAARL